MKIKISFSLNNAYIFLKKYRFLILGAFSVFLLLLNIFICYQYIYRAITAQAEPVVNKISINQETLQKVLNNLDIREENLLRVETTLYADPFK